MKYTIQESTKVSMCEGKLNAIKIILITIFILRIYFILLFYVYPINSHTYINNLLFIYITYIQFFLQNLTAKKYIFYIH